MSGPYYSTCDVGTIANVTAWTNWVATANVTTRASTWANWTSGTSGTSGTATSLSAITSNMFFYPIPSDVNEWGGAEVLQPPMHFQTADLTEEQVVDQTKDWNVQREAIVQRREASRRQEEERQATLAALEAEEKKKRVEAEDRAMKLLLSNLTVSQLKNFNGNKCIAIDGKSGDRYRIKFGRSGNIDAFNKNGKFKYRLCVHPTMQVPDADTVLAQKLMLETDEEMLLRLANKTNPDVADWNPDVADWNPPNQV
jgi:hypothetical protein